MSEDLALINRLLVAEVRRLDGLVKQLQAEAQRRSQMQGQSLANQNPQRWLSEQQA